jgi:DNA-binding NtrC family response regulator
MSNRIIVADDDTSVIGALHMLLTSQGFEVSAVTTTEALLEQVACTEFAAALIDLNYKNDTTSGKEGLVLIEQLKQLDEFLPVIVMTGYSSIEIAVEAMKLGASDFVQKPWVNERLLHILRTQIQLGSQRHVSAKLAHENTLLKTQLQSPSTAIVARSKTMRQLITKLQKLAQSDMSILLTGENGTGKSMFAGLIHQYSGRQKQPFISVNMGAIAETLFESEMFGHVKGAFTDAKENRIGRFELAQSGSIFLDEIANISLTQQAKLLRVLEERQFEKVGSNKTQKVDVRLVSATNADIQKLIAQSEFRQDLLYRLNTVTLHIPALRERTDDIEPLAYSFLTQFGKKYRMPVGDLGPDAIDLMMAYSWPGNIRELAHTLERAMFMRTSSTIMASDLGLPVNDNAQRLKKSSIMTAENLHISETASLDELEKEIIQARLAIFDNNPQKTAKSLGLSRSAYYRRIEKYQLLGPSKP